MRTTLAVSSLAIVALSGCRADRDRSSTTVTDSAGIRITLSAGAPGSYAEIDPTPLVSIGGPNAAGAAQFFNIRGVHLDRDHRLWVADGGSAEVRIFGPDGTPVRTLGGQGGGPGEFRRLRLLGAFRGDTVALWDDAASRLTLMSPEGEFVGTTPVGGTDDRPPPQALGVYHDGSLLAREPRTLAAASLSEGQLLADTARLLRIDVRDGERNLQAVVPGPIWLWTARSQVPLPFTTNPATAIHGNALLLSSGEEFRVRVVEDGAVHEVFGVEHPPRAVTGEDVEAYTALFTDMIPDEAQRTEYLSGMHHPDRPDFLPAYSTLLVADDSSVWAQRYTPDLLGPARWDVYDPERTWLGQVRTPRGFQATAVRGDRIAGVWRDDNGVEHVRVFRWQPPTWDD